MTYTAIQAEHLSKRFLLDHQVVARYTTLRDVLTERFRSLVAKKTASVTKDEFWALNDVSFSVNSGDRVGIVGRNGAGKSTLLKVLSRIVRPTRGRVTIEGRIASLLEVGTGFHSELSGRENIYLNGSILGMSKGEIDRKFDEIVAFAEVERFLDTPVKRYSSGMYVRLAFAVAAQLEPEILIVDEVLAVGDQSFQRKCLGRMREVAGEGRTVLFVSHNMSAVQRLCNKGILLNAGRLVTTGDIDAVVTRYLQEASGSQSVYEYPEPSDQGIPCFVCKLQVEDRDGNPSAEIPVGAYFQVRIRFRIRKDIDDFVVGLGITTLMEMPVRTTWSTPGLRTPGDYEAVFMNDGLQLADGQYKMVVGLSQHGRTFQYTDNAGILTISEVSTVAYDPRIVNTKSGLIINQMNVEITQVG